jgi:hypothetical protein
LDRRGFHTGYWNNWLRLRGPLAQATLARLTNTACWSWRLQAAAVVPGERSAARRALAARGCAGVYSGQLAFEPLATPCNPRQPTVDLIRLWWSPLANSSSVAATDMIVAASVLLDSQVQPLQARFNKPVILSAAYLAADGAATQCLRRTDGACYAFEEFEPSAPDTSPYGLDLQEQADAYNGLLTAINDRPWVGGLFSYGYNPMALLRDKSVSVRGKPAEVLLSAWYCKDGSRDGNPGRMLSHRAAYARALA